MKTIYKEKTNDRFQVIWNSANEAMVLSDEKGRVIDANEAYLALYGYSKEEIIDKDFSIIFPPEKRRKAKEDYHEFFHNKKRATSVRSIVRCKDGSYRTVDSRFTLIREKDEVLMLSIIHDITQEDQMLQNTRFLSEASKVLSSSLDFQKTLDAVAKLAVPAIADWCGVDILNEKGQLQQVAVQHKDPKKVKWAKELRKAAPIDMTAPTGLPNVLRTGKAEIYPVVTDEMLVKGSKSKKELELTRSLGLTSVILVPLFSDKKPIGGITLVTTESKRNYQNSDLYMAIELAARASLSIENARLYQVAQNEIKERQKAEKESQDSFERLQFMADSMPQQVWTATPDGALDYVNQYTFNYFKKSVETIIGDGWQKVIHKEDLPECIKLWTASLETGKPYQVFFRLRRHDGTYRWHLGRALALKDKKKIVKWFGTNTDIDDQKKLEKQKDDFIGIVSHELKTPVTSLKAYAQVLQMQLKKIGQEKIANTALKMDSQLDKLTVLINDLLDVTKIEEGQMQFTYERFSITELVKEIVEQMQLTSTKHTILYESTTTKLVYADKERTGQVIINLLSNAIKYSPDSDAIHVNVSSTTTDILVSVMDYGMGIPTEKQQYLFERFYRVSGPKTVTFPGLGLGLYICAEIVKSQQGKLWVQSEVGKGSTFSFSLPLKKSPGLK